MTPLPKTTERAVLGIDPGLKLGYCVVKHGKIAMDAWGKLILKKKQDDPPGKIWNDLWLGLESIIKAARQNYDIRQIWYEEPFVRGNKATAFLVGVTHQIQRHAAIEGIEIHHARPAQFKKFATDNGLAPKPCMRVALKRWMKGRGQKIPAKITYDEVDAAWIAIYGWEKQDG